MTPTTPASASVQSEQDPSRAAASGLHNPWRTTLEACMCGDNQLSASDYHELIEELDDLQRYRSGQHSALNDAYATGRDDQREEDAEIAALSQPAASQEAAVPSHFDEKALEIARRFTLDIEPQQRASLQVAVLEAMQWAKGAEPMRNIGWWVNVEDGLPDDGDVVLCEMDPEWNGPPVHFGFMIEKWDEAFPVAEVIRWIRINRLPESPADFENIDRLQRLSTHPQQPSATGGDGPAKVTPYDPTEAMRWAMKRIDPALTHEQCRALWSAAWTATPASQPTSGAAGDADSDLIKRVAALREPFEAWATGQGYVLTPEDRGYMRTYFYDKTEHAWRGYCHAALATPPAQQADKAAAQQGVAFVTSFGGRKHAQLRQDLPDGTELFATPQPSQQAATSGFVSVVPGSFVPNPEMSTEVPGLTKGEAAQYLGQRKAFEASQQAPCRSQNAESDPQAGLSLTGEPEEDMFEFWWSSHMPKATRNEAWAAWLELKSPPQQARQPMSEDEVWVAACKALRLGEYPVLNDAVPVGAELIPFCVQVAREIEAHHRIASPQAEKEGE